MTRAVAAVVNSLAVEKKSPDQQVYRSISISAVAEAAAGLNIPLIEVEKTALLHDIIPERYARNLKTCSAAQQLRLLQSAVTVVGLGGLGGTVVEILARAGIGTLCLIDGDRFEDHNLNRQLTSAVNLLGTPKSLAAQTRVAAVNPALMVEAHGEFLDEKNAARLLGSAEVVVDCLDNIDTRLILGKTAKKMGLPMVSAAVGGLFGQVTTIFPQDPGIETIYGPKDSNTPSGAETALGCLPQIVTMIAALQSSEIFKILLQRGTLLRRRLFIADLEDNTFETLTL